MAFVPAAGEAAGPPMQSREIIASSSSLRGTYGGPAALQCTPVEFLEGRRPRAQKLGIGCDEVLGFISKYDWRWELG